jgi:hypothetical protein
VGARRVVLKTVGDFGELWCRGILIPQTKQHVPKVVAPEGGMCAKHASVAATIACAKCGTFACAECEAVDATHCAACMGVFTEADLRAIVLAPPPGPLEYFGKRLLIAAVVFGIVYGIKWLVGD